MNIYARKNIIKNVKIYISTVNQIVLQSMHCACYLEPPMNLNCASFKRGVSFVKKLKKEEDET